MPRSSWQGIRQNCEPQSRWLFNITAETVARPCSIRTLFERVPFQSHVAGKLLDWLTVVMRCLASVSKHLRSFAILYSSIAVECFTVYPWDPLSLNLAAGSFQSGGSRVVQFLSKFDDANNVVSCAPGKRHTQAQLCTMAQWPQQAIDFRSCGIVINGSLVNERSVMSLIRTRCQFLRELEAALPSESDPQGSLTPLNLASEMKTQVLYLYPLCSSSSPTFWSSSLATEFSISRWSCFFRLALGVRKRIRGQDTCRHGQVFAFPLMKE